MIFLSQISPLFPFKVDEIESSLKYLCFFLLKPNNYKFEDYLWLVKKIEKRIGN